MSDPTMAPPLLIDGPPDGAIVVLAHGAGLPMDAPFMETFAKGLSATGLQVVRFEFPYMQRRRKTGKKSPPDRPATLETTWRAVINELGDPSTILIGGKSMGGRVASMIADDVQARGLVCLGYPFHAIRKHEHPRVAHLESMRTRALIVQGERDPMGNRADVATYSLSPAIELRWIDDGEHSFIPRKRSGRTEAENLLEAVEAVRLFETALG